MRSDLAPVGAELAVSSFKWLVHDGMVLDPVRHRFMLGQLNYVHRPFRYRDLERLAKFQNVGRQVRPGAPPAVHRHRAADA